MKRAETIPIKNIPPKKLLLLRLRKSPTPFFYLKFVQGLFCASVLCKVCSCTNFAQKQGTALAPGKTELFKVPPCIKHKSVIQGVIVQGATLHKTHDALWHRVAPRASNLNKIRSAKLILARILSPETNSKFKLFNTRC